MLSQMKPTYLDYTTKYSFLKNLPASAKARTQNKKLTEKNKIEANHLNPRNFVKTSLKKTVTSTQEILGQPGRWLRPTGDLRGCLRTKQ